MARDWTLFEIEDLKRLKEVEKLMAKFKEDFGDSL